MPAGTEFFFFFFFNDTATTEIYTLSLHDALPISAGALRRHRPRDCAARPRRQILLGRRQHRHAQQGDAAVRSEEHTSELQSLAYLVCRLLLEKKKTATTPAGVAALNADTPPS